MSRFLFSFTVLAVLAAPAFADEIKLLNGKSVIGTLEKITDTEITVKSANGPVATPLAQVLDVILRPGKLTPTAEKYTEVVLADDSILRCNKITFGAKEWQLDLTTGATVKVPGTAIISFLRDAQDPNLRKQWTKYSKIKTRNDRIFSLKTGELNPIEGILQAIDDKDESIKFTLVGKQDPVDIKLDRLHAISYVRTDAPVAASLCKVIDTDGNTLVASKLGFDGSQLSITSPVGTKIALDPKTLARLDFNFGRLTYLSDLAGKISDTPLLGGFSAVRKDANLDGEQITLMGKQYPKGLSMYAGVELAYDLGGRYREFKAQLGVDSRIAEEGQGMVTVTIFCDNERRWSEPVSAKAVKNLAINVKDVSTLRIVVSGANFTNFSGHATLANAHVSQ